MKIKVLYVLKYLIIILLIWDTALGAAPVFDITQQASSQEIQTEIPKLISNELFIGTNTPSSSVSLPVQSLTNSQRLTHLEQQIHNLTNMNLPQQITDLQQQLAQMRGQLQEQQRDLQLVNNQLRSFYNDLNQRITQLKNLNSDVLNNNTSLQKTNRDLLSDNGNIQLKDSITYQKALNFLTKKRYDRAEAFFQNYLNDYPNGNYVANAHYWLGEIYLEQKNRKKAVLEFQMIKDEFPNFEKMPNAQLKLAIIHAENGQFIQAKQELVKIEKQYSRSTIAQLASIYLQQLKGINFQTVERNKLPSVSSSS